MFLGTDRLPWHCSGQVLRYRAQHHYSDAAAQPLGAPYQRQGNTSSIMDNLHEHPLFFKSVGNVMNCLRPSHLTLLSWKSTKEQKKKLWSWYSCWLCSSELAVFAQRWWWPAKCTTCISWDSSCTACAMGRAYISSVVTAVISRGLKRRWRQLSAMKRQDAYPCHATHRKRVSLYLWSWFDVLFVTVKIVFNFLSVFLLSFLFQEWTRIKNELNFLNVFISKGVI